MNLDQYTPDAICRSMGMQAFIEPGWSPPVLRLLLKPSFHAEVCVTLAGDGGVLSVVALAESLWRQSAPCELPTFRERTLLAAQVAHQIYSGFSTAFVADQAPEGRMVCLDGMPLTCCLLDSDGIRQFACNPYRPAVSAFVAFVIHAAWQACSGAGVRNGLVDCGRYVGLKLPREPETVPPKLFRIAVLGTPDNRADFFEKLQQKKGPGRNTSSATEDAAMDERLPGEQPLDDAATGCTLAFTATGPMYQPMSALAVLAGLNGRGFTGVCECYIRPGLRDGEYLMGIGLRFGGEPPPDEWWGAFVGNVGHACAEDEEVRLVRDGCEFASVGELRAAMRHAGTAGFEDGLAVWVSDPAGPDPDSPFTMLCRSAR